MSSLFRHQADYTSNRRPITRDHTPVLTGKSPTRGQWSSLLISQLTPLTLVNYQRVNNQPLNPPSHRILGRSDGAAHAARIGPPLGLPTHATATWRVSGPGAGVSAPVADARLQLDHSPSTAVSSHPSRGPRCQTSRSASTRKCLCRDFVKSGKRIKKRNWNRNTPLRSNVSRKRMKTRLQDLACNYTICAKN